MLTCLALNSSVASIIAFAAADPSSIAFFSSSTASLSASPPPSGGVAPALNVLTGRAAHEYGGDEAVSVQSTIIERGDGQNG